MFGGFVNEIKKGWERTLKAGEQLVDGVVRSAEWIAEQSRKVEEQEFANYTSGLINAIAEGTVQAFLDAWDTTQRGADFIRKTVTNVATLAAKQVKDIGDYAYTVGDNVFTAGLKATEGDWGGVADYLFTRNFNATIVFGN